MARNRVRVVRIDAPVVLQFANGFRLRLEPSPRGGTAGAGRRGRNGILAPMPESTWAPVPSSYVGESERQA